MLGLVVNAGAPVAGHTLIELAAKYGDRPILTVAIDRDGETIVPVTLRSDTGLHLSLHEADLTDYAGMTLKVDPETLTLISELVGSGRTGYAMGWSPILPFPDGTF